MFLKPGSRNIVRYGTPVPCSSLTSVMYKTARGWIKVGGDPILTPKPLEFTVQTPGDWSYEEIHSFKDVGYLTNKQLEDFKNKILGPMEHQAIIETWSGRAITKGLYPDQGIDFNAVLNNDNLVHNITSKVLSKIYTWDFVIRYLGVILGFTILYDLILAYSLTSLDL